MKTDLMMHNNELLARRLSVTTSNTMHQMNQAAGEIKHLQSDILKKTASQMSLDRR